MYTSYLKPVIYLAIGLLAFKSIGQSTTSKLDTSSESSILAWINDLYAEGVKVTNDSIILSDETNKILRDTVYFALIFPKTYTWEPVVKFIQNQDLKPAIWYLINLYPLNEKNKDLAVKSILSYDAVFKMDKMLPSVFATYSILDPEIGSIHDGHSEITAPHILEKKLNVVKELMYYVEKNRSLIKK